MIRAQHTYRAAMYALPCLFFVSALCLVCNAQDTAPSREDLHEPVYHVGRAIVDERTSRPTPPAAGPVEATSESTLEHVVAQPVGHALDPAIEMAEQALARIQATIDDYTCMIQKREQVNGRVLPAETMYAKIRSRKGRPGQATTPFSVYLKFHRPKAAKDREVVYVEGQNNNKLYAHEGGLKGRFMKAWLDPTGAMAMRGNRYPISEIGFENLTARLIERGSQDREHPECKMEIIKNAQINGRICTCYQVEHTVRRPEFDFFKALIYVDDELGVPVRYEAHDWPVTPGGTPVLIEEYTYYNIQVNVGLTDADFSADNPKYDF